MTLAISINGVPYQNFISASVNASVGTLVRAFSFVSTADVDNNFPVKVGDRVIITADGIQILDGYIESIEINYNDLSHDIQVSGRSLLCDLIDSSAPNNFEKSGSTLESIARDVLRAIGIDAEVENQAGTIQSFGNDKTSAEIGMTALEFLESYSRKRQVILTSDGGSTLILTRAGNSSAPEALKNIRGARDNNIIDANRSIDFSNRFYRYTFKSQLNTSIDFFDSTPKEVADQSGSTIDKQIRKSRLIEMNAEESSASFSLSDRAVWERNIRIGNSETYTATVVGNSVKGKLWLPNTKVKIVDQYCQINSVMLIRDVKYDFDLYRGSRTTLTMVTEGSLSLEVEQTARKANTKKESNNLLADFASGVKI